MLRIRRAPPGLRRLPNRWLAVGVGANGAGEGAERGRADRAVLLVTAEGVAVAHVAELPHARATDPGLDLERASWARPVRVPGGTEQWWVHRDVLGRLDEEWVPRTTLLSPFDNLICDRDRTERL